MRQERFRGTEFLRSNRAVVLGCALIVGGARACLAADAGTVSPWATGGAKVAAGSTDGKAGPPQATAVPVAQATPWPGYVIQGGAIPQGWQPQPVPYQSIGPDGRPVTLYYAPTYTFTYPIGPPVPMLSPVNRRQAYPQPAAGNGWNYQTQGAAPPAYTLPPATVARYQPPPYRYPPNAAQLSGQPLAPPATPVPPVAAPSMPMPPPSASWQPPPLAPPPSQWVPSAPADTPPPAMVSMPQAPPATGRSATSHMWRVVGVQDGDTLTCLDENNQQQKVRLAEIDAPELGQDFGKVSREALASMVFGKTVEVVDEGKDRYGRWIGHVLVNGSDVNREMVATGNAWHYAAYSKDQSLAQLQSQARAQQIGLWAQPDPVAPWQFRSTEKK
ncbi:MAG: thermonuclease family protein [Planctomycetia bacterium]